MSRHLSPRLTAISDLIEPGYDHIWDCCCDHGLLGQALLEYCPQSKVHFVDVVPELIERLEEELKGSGLPQDRWQVYAQDLRLLDLRAEKGRHLVIIAGVGGDLLLEFVEAISRLNTGCDLDFILCPIRQIYKVRSGLRSLGLGLLNEKIVQDKGRFYEVIYVSARSDTAISQVGQGMWDFNNPTHTEYLQLNLKHYQRMSQSKEGRAVSALECYQALLALSLDC
jgi:tRNA (adenine22-N1)-methyltransferase